MLKWLDGKKTYFCLAGFAVAVGLTMAGVPVPPQVTYGLGVGAGIFMRRGVKKAENAAKKAERKLDTATHDVRAASGAFRG